MSPTVWLQMLVTIFGLFHNVVSEDEPSLFYREDPEFIHVGNNTKPPPTYHVSNFKPPLVMSSADFVPDQTESIPTLSVTLGNLEDTTQIFGSIGIFLLEQRVPNAAVDFKEQAVGQKVIRDPYGLLQTSDA